MFVSGKATSQAAFTRATSNVPKVLMDAASLLHAGCVFAASLCVSSVTAASSLTRAKGVHERNA